MKKSACEQVIDYILNKLQTREWVSGMKIATEAQLQQATGVGKTSVREAVEKLVTMDVLTKRQGDGTYVNSIHADSLFVQSIPVSLLSTQDSISILEFRVAVEPACVELFIRHFDEEVYRKLPPLLQRMEQHQDDTRSDVFYMADRDFHLTIAQGSGNPIMMKIMEILSPAFTDYHHTANQAIGARSGVAEHRAVMEAIAQKDAELASLLMKRHLERSLTDMQAYLAAEGKNALL